MPPRLSDPNGRTHESATARAAARCGVSELRRDHASTHREEGDAAQRSGSARSRRPRHRRPREARHRTAPEAQTTPTASTRPTTQTSPRTSAQPVRLKGPGSRTPAPTASRDLPVVRLQKLRPRQPRRGASVGPGQQLQSQLPEAGTSTPAGSESLRPGSPVRTDGDRVDPEPTNGAQTNQRRAAAPRAPRTGRLKAPNRLKPGSTPRHQSTWSHRRRKLTDLKRL